MKLVKTVSALVAVGLGVAVTFAQNNPPATNPAGGAAPAGGHGAVLYRVSPQN